MKKKLALIALAASVCAAAALPAGATPVLTVGDTNEIYFNNFENLYSADGVLKAPGADVVVGDHLFGIINVQNIDFGGTGKWFAGMQDQLSGVFAQRVEAIYLPTSFGGTGDVFDPAQTAVPHLVLGTPTLFTYGTGASAVDISGKLAPGEMFAFYSDARGAATTVFESNGTILDDFTKATDGDKWLSMGYTAGPDGIFGTADDDGYFYSHPSLGLPLVNFTGEAWGGLNVIVNNTGVDLGVLDNPFENEMGIFLGGILNGVVMSSELEGNPNYSANSPWAFRSNDPAEVNVVPEPGTMLLLGSGLLGLAGVSRRRLAKKQG